MRGCLFPQAMSYKQAADNPATKEGVIERIESGRVSEIAPIYEGQDYSELMFRNITEKRQKMTKRNGIERHTQIRTNVPVWVFAFWRRCVTL